MADFVISDAPFFFLTQAPALSFRASHHFLHRGLQIALGDLAGSAPRCQKSRFIEEIGQVRAGKAGSLRSNFSEIGASGQGFVPGVQFEHGKAPLYVRRIDQYLTIKPARPEQSAVEHFGPIGGRQNDDAGVRFKSVQADEQLIEGLLALVIDRSQMDPSLPPDRIQFVNKNDARGLRLGFHKKIPHPRRPHADEHLHEITAADEEKRHFGLARHGTGQEGLASPGRPNEENAPGNRGAEGLVA